MIIKLFKNAYKGVIFSNVSQEYKEIEVSKKSYFEELEDEYGKLTFGNVLKSLRECEDETQADFARRLGLPVEDICALEEERVIPTPPSAVLIAKKLHLPEKVFIDLVLRDRQEFSLKDILLKVS